MNEKTIYDVYTDVDGVEELVCSLDGISKVKDSILNISKKYTNIIVRPDIFSTANTIGDIERSSNVRIEPRLGVV